MKIDFILSDTTKCATTNAIKTVVGLAEQNLFENYIVIVPETKSIIIEKEILNLSKTKSFLNIFVYSFVRLLDRFESIKRENLVSKQTCIILLRKIILENINKLTCYKKSAKMIGFAEKIYETIAQFKSCNITPEELKLTLIAKQDSLRLKLNDIILIYEEYEKALSARLYDDCDKLALISKLATSNEFLKSSNVFVVGFDNITPEMQLVLRDIAKNSKSITFSSVYFDDKRGNKYIQNNELYKKYKYIADSLKFPYIPKIYYSQKNHDLNIIAHNLFSQSNKIFISKGEVKIFEADSIKQEIDFVANTILREIDNGKRFKDMGVLALNLNDTYELIEECFDLYKIPYFINLPRKIDDNFLIKFVLLAFEIFIFHLQKEKVLEFISNPIFNIEDFDLLDSFINEVGINYFEFTDEKIFYKLKKYYDRDENIQLYEDEKIDLVDSNDFELINKKRNISSKIEKIAQILIKFQDFYKKFNELLKNSNKVCDYISAINYLFDYFSILKILPEISKFQRENDDRIGSQITELLPNKIDSFNNQLSTFLGDNEVTLTEFLSIYKTGFASTTINLSPLSIDCVIIQNNTDGFYNIKDMFLVGAVEGNFPTKITDTGIILDSELDETKALIGKPIEPKTVDINIREKFRAYEALLEPTEKLFITYSLKSITGKQTKPARIVNDIYKLFNEQIKYKKYEKSNYYNYDILEMRFAQKINQFQNSNADITEKNGINYYYSLLDDKLDLRLKSYIDSFFTKKSFYIIDSRQLFFAKKTTSVSKIQTYFDCPYKFFATYGINLKENKTAKANVLDVGIIIHRVAEFFAKGYKNYFKLNDDELKVVVKSLLDDAINANDFIIEKNKTLLTLLYDECYNLCKYMIFEQENSSFKIDKVEYYFSEENGIKIAISDDDYITIVGKIDRIDKFDDYVRVIDYKTGHISDNLKSIFYGTKIQLAIYLKAIQNYDSKKVASILYFPIHSSYSDEKELLDTYKMTGFVLDDVNIMMKMDHSVSETNLKSHIVPLTIKIDKKTNEITYSGRIRQKYSDFQFKDICDYVDELSKTATKEILSGYNEPSPISTSESEIPDSCTHCKLFGFCGLENSRNKFGRNISGNIDISSFSLEGDFTNE